MVKEFSFPDGTVVEAPDDTTLEEAVTIFDNREQFAAPPPEPEPEEPSLLEKADAILEAVTPDILNEAVGGTIRRFQEIAAFGIETFDVQRRLKIDADTESALDAARGFGTLTPEKESKIRESGRRAKFEGPAAAFSNLLQLNADVMARQLEASRPPIEVREASVVETFEEEGFGPAVKLFARKAPEVIGEQVANLGIMVATGGRLSATPIFQKAFPGLMKNGIFKGTLGQITPQTLAAGATAGILEGSAAVHEAIEKGASDEQVAAVFMEMTIGSTFLNSIGAGPLFRVIPKGAKGRLTRLLLTSGAEGLTEGLEEFVQADALDRAGIEKAEFHKTIRQAIEAALFGVLVGGVFSGGQQLVFSPETELELTSPQIRRLAEKIQEEVKARAKRPEEIIIEASPEVAERLEAAKTAEEFDAIAREEGLLPPTPFTMSDESFAAVTEISRLPGQSVDREAGAVSKAVYEVVIQELAESQGLDPQVFLDRFLTDQGLFDVVEGKQEAAITPELAVSFDTVEDVFTGKEDNRTVEDLARLAVGKRIKEQLRREAFAALRKVGFLPNDLVNEEGVVTNEAALARLNEVKAGLQVVPEAIGPEVVEEEGLEQVAPQPTPEEEEIAPVVEAIVELAAAVKPLSINSQAVADAGISSSNTLRIQDDLGLLSDEDFAKELGFTENKQVADYKRQVRVQKKRIKFAKAADIKTALLNTLDEAMINRTIFPAGANAVLTEEGATPGSWILLITELGRRDNTAAEALALAIRSTFGEIVRENITKTRITLEEAKGMIAEAVDIAIETDTSLQKRVLTPDGKNISLLTADLAARTRTKAFKDWFGDSKVVDANGEPLVVFHGTTVVRFAPENQFNPLSHFGTARAATDRLSEPSEAIEGLRVDFPGETEDVKVIQSFLKIENPLEMADVSPFDKIEATRNELVRVLPNLEGELEQARVQAGPGEHNLAMAKVLQKEGFDGVTYTNSKEDPGSTSWVIFDSAQAKSPMNKGTYEVSNGNVLFSKEAGIIRGQLIGFDESGATTEIRDAAKFLIRAFQSSNISTAFHELAHFAALTAGGTLREDIEHAMATKAERESGDIPFVKDWDKKRHEKFAKSFERYMVTGIPPAKAWEKTFYIIKEKLALAYQTMRSYVLPIIDPELAKVFDSFFLHYGPGKAVGELNERLNQVDKLMNDRDSFGALNQKTGDTTRKYYNNVNMTHYDNDPVMKKGHLKILDEMGGIERVSDAEVMAKALDLLDTVGGKALRKRLQQSINDGSGLDDVEIMAASLIKDRIDASVWLMVARGKEGTPEYERAFNEIREILQIQQEAGNEKGRGLRMMKNFAMSAEDSLHFLDQMANADPAQIEQLQNLDLKKPEEMFRALKKLDGIGQRLFISAVITNFLSSPKTIGINLFSTMTHIALMAPVRGLGGFLDRIDKSLGSRKGQPRALYSSEAQYLLTSLITTPFRRDGLAWKNAWKAVTVRAGLLASDEDIRSMLTKVDESIGHSILNTWDVFIEGYDSSKPIYTVAGALGAFARFGRRHERFTTAFTYTATAPTRILFGFDVFMKAIPELAEAAAIRQRLEKSGVVLEEGQISDEAILDRHIAQEKKMLGNTFDEVLENAEVFQEFVGGQLTKGEIRRAALIESYSKRKAEEGAFQTAAPKDSWTASIIKWKQSRPILGVILVPFVKTLSNVAHVTVEFTPGAPIVEAQLWDRATHDKEGVFARTMPAELAAKQLIGLTVLIYMYTLMGDDEDRLTGPAPRTKGERDSRIRQGIPDYAIRFGDTWYEYRKFEPFGTVLSLGATLFENIRRLNEDAEATPHRAAIERDLFEQFWFVTRDIAEVFTNGLWVSGALDLLTTVSGQVPVQQAKRNIARVASGMLVPYSSFWRYLNDSFNQRNYGGRPQMDDASIQDYIQHSLPVAEMWGSAADPAIDGLGQKIVRQSLGPGSSLFLEPGERGSATRQFLTGWTPFNHSILRPGSVEQQFIDANIYPLPPQRNNIDLGGRFGHVNLDEDIYIEYATQSGHDLKEAVRRRLKSMEKMNPLQKRRKLETLMESSRIRAKNAALREQRRRIREGPPIRQAP